MSAPDCRSYAVTVIVTFRDPIRQTDVANRVSSGPSSCARSAVGQSTIPMSPPNPPNKGATTDEQ